MKRILTIFFAAAAAFSAHADAYDDQIRSLEQKIAECQAEIDKDYAEKQRLIDENASSFRIEAVEKDIWMYENSIKSYRGQISSLRRQQSQAAQRESSLNKAVDDAVKKAQQDHRARQKADYDTQQKALEDKLRKEQQAQQRARQKAMQDARDEAERRERQLKYEQQKAEREAREQQARNEYDRKHAESWKQMSNLADDRADEMQYLRGQVSVSDAKKAFTAGASAATVGNHHKASSSQPSKTPNLASLKKAAQAAQAPKKTEEKPKPTGKRTIPQPKYD